MYISFKLVYLYKPTTTKAPLTKCNAKLNAQPQH